MKHAILHTLEHNILIIPFLFVAFLIIEVIEHKLSDKSKKMISKSGKFGPFFGSLLGLLPQCGFGVVATNLYTTRIISVGTLIAIYLSTSDEMLPIMISKQAPISLIIKILLIKFFIGMVCGFVIDFILRRKNTIEKVTYEICDEEECHCKNGIIKSAIIHTMKKFIFLLVITFIINLIIEYIGEDSLSKLFLKDTIFSPFISSLIGLIPNCASSVLITELYLNNALTFGTMISVLLTGAGISILVLFKSIKNIKEKLLIILTLYLIGSITGIIINLIGILL